MTRKLKALGLAFVAVLAFGALSATAASAASFHSEAAHTILDGKQPVAEDDVFTVKAGTVKCTEATYTGTTESQTTAAVKVVPSYSGCTAFGFVNSPIDVPEGCSYLFGADGSLEINCTGEPITVTAFNCHVKVGTQFIKSGITYDNAGSGSSRDVTATANLTGLAYSQTNKAFPNCTGGSGSFTDGKYVGSGTVTGTNTTGGAVGIWRTA